MTDYRLAFTPLVPIELIALLAVAGLAVVALAVWSGRRGAWLRAAALALTLGALADPSIVREDRQPLKDVVAIVLDRSASQTIGQRKAQTDRATAELERRLGALDDVDLRIIEAGGGENEADGTRLFSALASGLADVPPERIGAAIFVTDGNVHDIPGAAEQLGFRAPLHVMVTGKEGERDRRVELVEAPRFGIVGKDQFIVVRVVEAGGGGEPVTLNLRRDGQPIASLRARPNDRIRIPVRVEHAGPNVVEIEAAPASDELTTINNKAVVTIEGVRDKLRVLLVSGEPHAGERMWRNLLKSDANVDLVHFTILRPPDKQDGTPINELSLIAFPTADLFGRKIRDFDLIIFDRYSNQSILPSIYFENIVRYVREGGALLMAIGPDFSEPQGLYYSPLGQISPARPDGRLIERPYRATITETGAKHPVTRGLPGGASQPPNWSEWYRLVGAEVSRGSPVLAGADDKPLLVLSRENKGRVGLLLSDQIWLWARNYREGGPQLDLLRRLAHWLMKEPDLEEEALRANARGREIFIERQSVKGAGGEVTIVQPSGAEQKLTLTAGEPGLMRGRFVGREFGLHRITDGELTVLANVGPENPREFQEVVSTTDKLRPLAEATGGTVRRIGAEGDAVAMPRVAAMRSAPVYGGADYVAIKRTEASVVTGVGMLPLGSGLIGLLALLGLIVAAWLWEGRRRKG